MKKILAALLTLAICLSFAACGVLPIGSTGSDTPLPLPTLGSGTSVIDIISTLPSLNEFRNDSNFTEDYGTLAVKPRHVYWEDGCLVAECFVINGLDTPAYNIEVENITFANQSGTLAEGAFGVLEDLVVGPHSYVTWTFRFSPDAVVDYNGDLSYLAWSVSTSYSH